MNYRIVGWSGVLIVLAGCGTPQRPSAGPPSVGPVVVRVTAAPPAPTSTPRLDTLPSPVRPSPTRTPAPTPSATATPSPTADPAPIAGAQHHTIHIVQPGETIAALEHDDVPAASILRYNHQHTDQLRPGQPLIVDATDALDQTILVEQGNPSQPRLALTFDAGSNSVPTPRLLDVLHEHNVHVTFFLTGRWMLENPTLTRRIVAEGHEIANHSFSHPDFTKLDMETIRAELEQTERLAQEIAGVSTRPYFRFPFGALNRRTLDTVVDAGYLPIGWTLDSLDAVGKPRTPEFLTERVTSRLSAAQLHGAIILMHCGSAPTAEALPAILDRFAAMGLEVTTVSEVLGP